MYTIEFTSTNTKIYRLSLNELVFQLSEHYARIGVDDKPIYITDSETGELYEVIEGENLNINTFFYCEKLRNSYRILDLVEMLPYI